MKSFDRNDPELWEYLPDWINYIAQIPKGIWYGYVNEPVQSKFSWGTLKDTHYYSNLTINIRLVENWQDSLTERPR